MTTYYQKYLNGINNFNNYQDYVSLAEQSPTNISVMTLYFNQDLYLDTQPVIPPLLKINMTKNGVNKYVLEQADINNIYNFFGGEFYPIGRKWSTFCKYMIDRPNEGLVNTINDIKIEYGI